MFFGQASAAEADDAVAVLPCGRHGCLDVIGRLTWVPTERHVIPGDFGDAHGWVLLDQGEGAAPSIPCRQLQGARPVGVFQCPKLTSRAGDVVRGATAIQKHDPFGFKEPPSSGLGDVGSGVDIGLVAARRQSEQDNEAGDDP